MPELVHSPDFAQWKCDVFPGRMITVPGGYTSSLSAVRRPLVLAAVFQVPWQPQPASFGDREIWLPWRECERLSCTPRRNRAIEAPIDLDSLPLLGVAHIIDSHVVVLTPKERNSVKLFATAKNILSRYLPLALSNHPVLHANSFAGVRIWPAGGIASGEDSGHVGFEVFIDRDTAVD